MAQRNDLGLHCSSAANAREKGIEHRQYKVEHGRRRLTATGRKSNNSYADEVFNKDNFNRHRVHSGLEGRLPERSEGTATLDFASYRWRQHCRGLYQTPIAA